MFTILETLDLLLFSVLVYFVVFQLKYIYIRNSIVFIDIYGTLMACQGQIKVGNFFIFLYQCDLSYDLLSLWVFIPTHSNEKVDFIQPLNLGL